MNPTLPSVGDVRLDRLESADPRIEPLRSYWLRKLDLPAAPLEEGRWIGAFLGEKLIGCVCIRDYGVDGRYASQMYVAPRRNGVLASLAFADFFKQVKDKPLLMVTHPKNHRMADFLAKNGAKEIGSLWGYAV